MEKKRGLGKWLEGKAREKSGNVNVIEKISWNRKRERRENG